jgi:hypothetical protein
MTKVRIALILEPLPGGIPWEVRVRKALKSLLRAYGLRNALFVTPEALEANPGLWREVLPVPGADATTEEVRP